MKTVISRLTPLALFLAGMGTIYPVEATQAQARSQAPGDVAADRLARIGTVHAKALASAIRRQDWQSRKAEGTSSFQAPGAAEPLTLALNDANPVVRRIAAWGLSEMRATGAQHQVARLLSDSVPEVRAEAARALGDMEATDYSARVAALLQDRNVAVRLEAAHALGDFQNPASRSALEGALRDSEPQVRAKAEWALRRVAEAETILRRSKSR